MSPGATFERVYQALKQQIGAGGFGAGHHLEPAALSQRLNASITPVRDALHRLVGEGLVEAPRGDGFRTPLVTELGVRHLYRWNSALLDLATRSRRRGATMTEEKADAGDPLGRTERLFLAVAATAPNPEHVAAVARLNERLRPIRRIEVGLLGVPEEEITEMTGHFANGAIAMLRRSIGVYHRKRERLAPDIVAALHGPH